MARTISGALLIVLVAFSSQAAEQSRSVPQAFRGYWEHKIELCGKNESDSGLIVSASRLEFHESEGRVKAVIVNSSTDITVIAQFNGEDGETGLNHVRFHLSADRTTLSAVFKDGPFVRYRCNGSP